MLNDVPQGREAPVVVKPALVRLLHEQAALADEDAGQVHGLVGFIRCPVGLKAVDPDLLGFVHIPTRLGPERLHVAIVAGGFATKEGVATRGCLYVEVDPWPGLWRWD